LTFRCLRREQLQVTGQSGDGRPSIGVLVKTIQAQQFEARRDIGSVFVQRLGRL
jgi:hypothetical protein